MKNVLFVAPTTYEVPLTENIEKKFKYLNEKKFELIYSGIFQVMSLYLSLAKHGVFQFIRSIQLL